MIAKALFVAYTIFNKCKKSMKSKTKTIGTAIVGKKGQIVIPSEIRNMFGIEEGDTLILMADKKRGIAIVKGDFVSSVLEKEGVLSNE